MAALAGTRGMMMCSANVLAVVALLNEDVAVAVAFDA